MICFPFFNKGKQCGNAASQTMERFKTSIALLTCPSSLVHQLTDTCNVKRKMKSDSCLSFQTAELTDDLPVWLASVLNSSFQLHSATCIQWWESYRNWTVRAASRVGLKLIHAHSTCNFCSTDQFFFFREWAHPDLNAYTENNITKMELNKLQKRNNYAATTGICS